MRKLEGKVALVSGSGRGIERAISLMLAGDGARLVADAPKLKRYGVPRLVRDVLQVSRFLEMKGAEVIKRIVLNGASALARHCVKSLRTLLKREHVSVILGET